MRRGMTCFMAAPTGGTPKSPRRHHGSAMSGPPTIRAAGTAAAAAATAAAAAAAVSAAGAAGRSATGEHRTRGGAIAWVAISPAAAATGGLRAPLA